MEMAATLAGCKMALVGTGSTISCLSTNGCRNHFSLLVGAAFLYLKAVFSQAEGLLVE